MLCSRFRRRAAANDGFTLVEVLVVILIVGILATLAMGAFLNQRAKAQDAGAKTAATTAATAMIAFNADHDTFDGATVAALVKIEPALGQARDLKVDAEADTFTVTVESASGDGAGFAIERLSSGELVHTCTLPGTGSCLAEADPLGNRW